MNSGSRSNQLAAVRASNTLPPHSIDEPQGDVAYEENSYGEDCVIAVDDKEEVVNVDHLLGVPRAELSLLWIAMWTEPICHTLY